MSATSRDVSAVVATSSGLAVSGLATSAAGTAHVRRRPAADVSVPRERSQRADDVRTMIVTGVMFAALPAAAVTGMVLGGAQAAVAAAGITTAVVMRVEYGRGRARVKQPARATQPARCASCGAAQVEVVSAETRRWPTTRTVLQAWCTACWTRAGIAARVAVVWWLPAPCEGSWMLLDGLVDAVPSRVCGSCRGQHGPLEVASWAPGAPLEDVELRCARCTREADGGSVDEPSGWTTAPLAGRARTASELASLVAGAHAVRVPHAAVARTDGGDPR